MQSSPDGTQSPQLWNGVKPSRSLNTLPELQVEAAKVALIPVTERCIEAAHAITMKALLHRHAGPLSVSMAIRLREIEKRMHKDKNFSQTLCEMATMTKQVHKIPKMLGLQMHPWLVGLPEKCQRSFLVAVLTRVIYRCDLPSQFEDYGSARSFHFSMQPKRSRPPPSRVTGFAALQLAWVTDHVRTLRSTEGLYSMPLSKEFLPHMQDFSERLAPQSARPQHHDMMCDVEVDASVLPFDGLGPHNEGQRVYFRFVHVSPKSQKLPVVTSDKLRSHDMAVQLLCMQDVRTRSVDVGHFHRHRVALLSYMESDVGWLREQLWVHDLSPQVQYKLVGAGDAFVNDPTVSALVEKVFANGAFAGHQAQCWIPTSDPLHLQAQSLCDAGVLQADPGAACTKAPPTKHDTPRKPSPMRVDVNHCLGLPPSSQLNFHINSHPICLSFTHKIRSKHFCQRMKLDYFGCLKNRTASSVHLVNSKFFIR